MCFSEVWIINEEIIIKKKTKQQNTLTWKLWKLTRSPDQQLRALPSVILSFLTQLISFTVSSVAFLGTDVDRKSAIK